MTGSRRYRERRYKHPDPVTPELRAAVLTRDGYRCVAPRLGATDPCRDRWENLLPEFPARAEPPWELTLDHVKDQPRMGKRAPSDLRHLVTLCWHHHLNGWATAHRPELRRYLEERDTDRGRPA